jgi:hypothetical protein
MITLNNTNELTEFLNNNDLPTIVGVVSFAGDLLAQVRANEFNQICIDEEIGFCDDGGWIEIDDNGVVVEEMYLP